MHGRPKAFAEQLKSCKGNADCEANVLQEMGKESAENIQKLKACWDAGDEACVTQMRTQVELNDRVYAELRQQDYMVGRLYEDTAHWYASVIDNCQGKCDWLSAHLQKTLADGVTNAAYAALAFGPGGVSKSGKTENALEGNAGKGGTTVKPGGTVELFTDARGPQIPGAVGVGPKDATAVAADARHMSNIPSGSQAKVVANNPFIPKEFGGTGSVIDFLPEAQRIIQPGGKVIINMNEANPNFKTMPSASQLKEMGLKIEYQGTLLPEYQGLTFRRLDGSNIPNSTMRTIILVKD